MLPSETRLVKVVREALEGVMAPSRAQALLFESLVEWGPEQPLQANDLVRFVRDMLTKRLVEQIGADDAKMLGAQIIQVVAAAPTPAKGFQRKDLPKMVTGRKSDERTTSSIKRSALPLIAVVAGTEQLFADRLVLALGPERVAPHLARDRKELQSVLAS